MQLVVLLLCIGLVSSMPGWELAWEENFDTLNFNNWQHEITAWGGGNYEFQTYTNDPENVYVRDGKLFIKPTMTVDRYGPDVFRTGSVNCFDYAFCSMDDNWGCFRQGPDVPPILSGRLRSLQRFSFKYGRIEFDAKMPNGDWLWPAIWLLPEKMVYGGWPRSGEIDIVEVIGNRDLIHIPTGDHIGRERAGVTLHWGPAWNVNKWWLTHGVKDAPLNNFGDFFHRYAMEWNERQMVFTINEQRVLSVPPDDEVDNFPGFWEFGRQNGGWGGHSNPWVNGTTLAPFDEYFHIILNVAVGGLGGYIPDEVINARGARPKPWRNDMSAREAYASFWADRHNWGPTWQGEDAALQVRNIRYYKRIGQPREAEEPEVEKEAEIEVKSEDVAKPEPEVVRPASPKGYKYQKNAKKSDDYHNAQRLKPAEAKKP